VLTTQPDNLTVYYPFDDALGSSVAASALQDEVNVILDSELETFKLNTVDGELWGCNGTTITAETVDVHSGLRAAKVAPTGNWWQTHLEGACRAVGAQPALVIGQTYTLKFWCHGDGTYAPWVNILDDTHAANIYNATTGVTGTSYVQITVPFTVPAGCLSTLIRFMSGDNAGVAYFDDIEVWAPASALPFNAAPTACTFGVAGIGDGKTAVRTNGTGFIQLPSAVLGLFNRDVGTISLWYRYKSLLDCPGGEGTGQTFFRVFGYLFAAERDNLWLSKDVETDLLYHSYFYSGVGMVPDTQHIEYYEPYNLNWHHLVVTWSVAHAEMTLYEDGAKPPNMLPPYTNNPDGIETAWRDYPPMAFLVGAFSGDPAAVWKGDLAHFALWKTELTASEVLALYRGY
jgi:hypothetical protein